MAKVIDAVLKLTDQFTPVLKNAQKAISQTSKQAMRAGKEIQKVGKNIEKVGKGLSVSVTAPLAAIGAASIKTTMDFDASMSKVQALSGATGKQLEGLRQKCIELGGSTAWSASQVSEAMQYMALAGWDSEAMLEGTKGIMDAASASGEDLANVCDIITDGLSAFNMTAKDSSRFADVLAKTAASSNTTIGMMGEAFTYAGSVAGSFNYSIEDTAVAIGLMANSGIKASQAGTALRKILTEMQGTVEITGDKLGSYVIEVANADGKMQPLRETIIQLRDAFSMLTESEKAAEAEAIAGKTGMAGLLAIVNASDESFNALVNSIDNSTGAAAEMSEVMLNNLSGQVTIIKSGIESLAISIGTLLTPYLSKVAMKVQDVVTKFKNLSDEQKMQIVKWAGIAASIGPALLVFGNVIKFIGKAVVTFGKFGKAVKGINTIKGALGLIFTPANTVVLVITAIALAAFLIIKYWKPIKAFFSGVFDKIKSILLNAGLDIENLKTMFVKLKTSFTGAIKNVLTVLSALWQAIGPILIGLGIAVTVAFSAVGGAIIGLLGGVFKHFGEFINRIIDLFGGIILFITSVFAGEWGNAWDGVVSIFKGIFGGLLEIARSIINGVIGVINGGIKGVHTVASFFGATKGEAPQIPMLYKGTNNWQGGPAMIHDKGAEIVDLPQGSRVIPHDKSLMAAKAEGMKQSSATQSSGIVINVSNLNVREESDIDKIANALYSKFKKQALNMA